VGREGDERWQVIRAVVHGRAALPVLESAAAFAYLFRSVDPWPRCVRRAARRQMQWPHTAQGPLRLARGG
jgi:hypothetical protein